MQAETISRWGFLNSLEEDSALVTKPIRDTLNRAGYFDGNYQYVKIANSVDINTGSSYPNRTISVWFQCDDVMKSGKQVIYEEGGVSNGFNIYIEQGVLYVGGWAGSGWPGTWHNSGSIESGLWHHTSLVLSSSSTFTAYLDGVSIGSTLFATALPKHSGDINIARNGKTKFHDNINNTGPNSFFGGCVDEFRIWNEARNLDSIQLEMHHELLNPSMENDLVCNLRFNQSEGTLIEDFSGSDNPGLLNSFDYISWDLSTAPIPYYSIIEGEWSSNNTWAIGQQAPQNSWARVEVLHDIIIRGDVICEELVIQAAASISVDPLNGLTVNSDLINNAGPRGLVLKSDARGASSLIHYDIGVQAEVESFYDLDQHYLIAAPINNAQSNIFLNQYMFVWDEALYEWQNFSETNVDLEICKGFDLYNINQQTATYSGGLNNGDLSISGLTYTDTGLGDPGFNLVGNPYPSVLDIRNVSFPEETFIFFTIRTIVAASHVLNSDTETYYMYSQGTNGGDVEARYIQPGQGFFVEVSAFAPLFGPPTFSVSDTARTHTGLGSIDKKEDELMNQEVLKMAISNESMTDASYVAFRDSASIEFDTYYDVTKLEGNSMSPYVFSFLQSDSVSHMGLNAFPLSAETEVLSLGLALPEEGEYTLTFSQFEKFNPSQVFYLYDKVTLKHYNLREINTIPFIYLPHHMENRFDLYFKEYTEIEEETIEKEIFFYVRDHSLYCSDHILYDDQSMVSIYNTLGQKMAEETIQNVKSGWSLALPSAYYVLRFESEYQYFTQKIFLK